MNAADDLRFMLDQMVIRLGKYLRILGFDAVWDSHAGLRELILRANREARVFVTRNQRVAELEPPPNHLFLVTTTDPVAQLRALIAAFQLDPTPRLFSRCIRCNVPLETVMQRDEIRPLVHPNVFTRHHRFFRCPNCGTVFWHGSHVQNTCRKLGLPLPLGQRPAEPDLNVPA